ncbi:hypothetical protein AVT69_gp197 [Pseudomonas phage PhiPA3]|uniref:Uncharacterized protein 199 n=1 Tax=Pseudomonas phage PhiPA3 TaxID=998086 RepID=F8SJ42_BPPA3|nr:hypothetical protein AVT69_gp197 [Pseudomonas phage PhiPA3]AEH03622.1 hypothetical protein [Pseudomonas phage PhiPA3]
MITRLRQWWRGLSATPKQKYTRWLEEINEIPTLSEELPDALVELWRRIDVDAISRQNPRVMMSAFFELRHANIQELIQTLHQVNDHVASGSASKIEYLSKNDFIKHREMSLDNYFVDAENYAVDIKEHLSQLKDLLITHGQILEIKEESFYRRMLGRLYFDVLALTETLVKHMQEGTDMK